MNCECDCWQEQEAIFPEEYCSQCGLAKYDYSTYVYNTQEKPNVSCTNSFKRNLWEDIRTEARSISDASINRRSSLKKYADLKHEFSANYPSTFNLAMSVAPPERDNRRHSSLNSCSRVHPTYSVPTCSHNAEIENEERLRAVEKSNHLVALGIEADALQASRWKIRSSLAEEEGRQQVGQQILGDERKKDINLAIAKQNEMEIIQAVEKRKLAEQETTAILQRQEIDALESTRRTLQLEAAKRRREDELADIQWRRRMAELAADEATRRRQALDDYLQMHRGPCCQPISTIKTADFCCTYSNHDVFSKYTNTDAIVGSYDQHIYPTIRQSSEGLCNYCQDLSRVYSAFQPTGSILTVPSKIAYTPVNEARISRLSSLDENPKRTSPTESKLLQDIKSYRSILKLASEPSVQPITIDSAPIILSTEKMPLPKPLSPLPSIHHYSESAGKNIKDSSDDKLKEKLSSKNIMGETQGLSEKNRYRNYSQPSAAQRERMRSIRNSQNPRSSSRVPVWDDKGPSKEKSIFGCKIQ